MEPAAGAKNHATAKIKKEKFKLPELEQFMSNKLDVQKSLALCSYWPEKSLQIFLSRIWKMSEYVLYELFW